MKTAKKMERIPFPDMEITENFQFNCACESGSFTFLFKWLNGRWNLWVTFPDGSVRQAGVEPNVASWSAFSDYGLIFATNLSKIDYNSLFLTEMALLTWA